MIPILINGLMGNELKKRIGLREEHIKLLLGLPESGMGYQLVDVTLKNGKLLKNKIVLNSQVLLLEVNEEIDPDSIDKVEITKR